MLVYDIYYKRYAMYTFGACLILARNVFWNGENTHKRLRYREFGHVHWSKQL